jgi:hypothetical protein
LKDAIAQMGAGIDDHEAQQFSGQNTPVAMGNLSESNQIASSTQFQQNFEQRTGGVGRLPLPLHRIGMSSQQQQQMIHQMSPVEQQQRLNMIYKQQQQKITSATYRVMIYTHISKNRLNSLVKNLMIEFINELFIVLLRARHKLERKFLILMNQRILGATWAVLHIRQSSVDAEGEEAVGLAIWAIGNFQFPHSKMRAALRAHRPIIIQRGWAKEEQVFP